MTRHLFADVFRSALLAGVSALASSSLADVATAQAPAPLTIMYPVNGNVVAPGQSITVTVTVASGTSMKTLAIFGQDPLGSAELHSVVGSTASSNLPIPGNTPPGSYTITAIGVNSAGELVKSAPISIVVERADFPTALSLSPRSISFRFVGDKLPWTIIGTFASGFADVTYSNHLTTTSENPDVATVQNGMVIAVGSGHTIINVTYGLITVKVPITVPNTNRDDLHSTH